MVNSLTCFCMGPNKKITGNFALIAFLSTTDYPIVCFVLFFMKKRLLLVVVIGKNFYFRDSFEKMQWLCKNRKKPLVMISLKLKLNLPLDGSSKLLTHFSNLFQYLKLLKSQNITNTLHKLHYIYLIWRKIWYF